MKENKEDIARELAMLKEAKLRDLQREAWRLDPILWLEERLKEDRKTFCWSEYEDYKDHEWDGDIDPLANAWRTLGNSYRDIKAGDDPSYKYVGIEAATGTSKTYWLARLVFWFLDCFENSLVITSAPKQDQLKLGLWAEIARLMPKVKRLRNESELFKLRLSMDNSGNMGDLDLEDAQNLDAWHAVGFVAGVGADEQSSNKARGFHRHAMLIILEECTGMPMPTMTAFQNTSTGNLNFIVAVGNPDNEFDPLHQFCLQQDVKDFRISAFDYPNIVTQKELFAGAVTQSSINSRTGVYGNGSPLWNAMVRGISPTQSVDSLIKLEWIEQCIDREFTEEELSGYNAVGVDVANSSAGDKAALAWGQSNILKEVQEFYCKNATHLAYNLIMPEHEIEGKGYENYNTSKLIDYNITGDCVGVDSVGIGVATVNAFLDSGYDEVVSLSGGCWDEVIPKEEIYANGKTIEKRMYNFSTLRAQMYWELREDLRRGSISIQLKDKTMLKQLQKELCVPKFKADSQNIEVERKPDIKKRLGGKSPNVADAVVYWNWTRKGYRINRFGFAALSGGDDYE